MKISVRINSFSYNTASKHLQCIKLVSYDRCKITFGKCLKFLLLIDKLRVFLVKERKLI